MLILGIESSCDETSVAVIDEKFQILANVVLSQIDIHKKYGGVVPEIAARNHIDNILPVLDEALKKAQISLSEITAVAATVTPGLPGAVMVGRVFGESLATALNVPFWPINHLHGHIASLIFSKPDIKLPMLCLLASGGHTALYTVDKNWQTKLLVATADDAVGEAFDKVARVLGLPYPGGPQISRQATDKPVTTPFLTKFPKDIFSYSGLKTTVLNYVNREKQLGHDLDLPAICTNFQFCAVEQLRQQTIAQLKKFPVQTLGICGGVSANQYLREKFTELCTSQNIELVLPQLELCGDNAAMIAAAGVLQIK